MEEFILWNSGKQNKAQILLFGLKSTSESRRLIEKLYHLIFFENICNHGSKRRACAACFYSLLPNYKGKLTEGCLRIFFKSPAFFLISIKFERTAIRTIRTAFLNCAIHECLFHLTKNMHRKLLDEGLL
ncbi:hypothetical protein MXB_2892 [Myxobolus squamalis]|nr:hypothetical protein MXB_2892 [Myxobolus squamalis]